MSKSFVVNSKDLFDKKKNPKLVLSPRKILKNEKIKKEIFCNNCYKPLTEKELSNYSIQWKHSGDMYCDKCREKAPNNN